MFRKSLPLLLLATTAVTACHRNVPVAEPSAHADIQRIAQEVARGDDRVTASELARRMIADTRDFVLVDVRPAAQFAKGHIEGAQNLSVSQLMMPGQLQALPKGHSVIVYSQGSELAAQAVVLLRLAGRDASMLLGGYNFWTQRLLNPDIHPIRAYGEFPRVPEQQAMACYFVGGENVAKAAMPAVPAYVPPVSAQPATPYQPSGGSEGC